MIAAHLFANASLDPSTSYQIVNILPTNKANTKTHSMPHAISASDMTSEWQTSHNTSSHRNSISMFDALKSKISRKSSNASTRSGRSALSNHSGEATSRRSSWRRSQNLQVDTTESPRASSNSLSPAAAESMASNLRPEGDMRNPSPATRRPGMF